MAGWNERQRGEVMITDEQFLELVAATVENRKRQKRDDDILRTVGGKLSRVSADMSPEELRKLLAEIGARLLSVGGGGS
jgi:hypothetical protein